MDARSTDLAQPMFSISRARSCRQGCSAELLAQVIAAFRRAGLVTRSPIQTGVMRAWSLHSKIPIGRDKKARGEWGRSAPPTTSRPTRSFGARLLPRPYAREPASARREGAADCVLGLMPNQRRHSPVSQTTSSMLALKIDE